MEKELLATTVDIKELEEFISEAKRQNFSSVELVFRPRDMYILIEEEEEEITFQ